MGSKKKRKKEKVSTDSNGGEKIDFYLNILTLILVVDKNFNSRIPPEMQGVIFIMLLVSVLLVSFPNIEKTAKFFASSVRLFAFLSMLGLLTYISASIANSLPISNILIQTISAVILMILSVILNMITKFDYLKQAKVTQETSSESLASLDYLTLSDLPSKTRKIWNGINIVSIVITWSFLLYLLVFNKPNFDRTECVKGFWTLAGRV